MTFAEVSKQIKKSSKQDTQRLLPLFKAPQTSHFRSASALPSVSSRRLPQSVQKTKEPMAAMILRISKLLSTDFLSNIKKSYRAEFEMVGKSAWLGKPSHVSPLELNRFKA